MKILLKTDIDHKFRKEINKEVSCCLKPSKYTLEFYFIFYYDNHIKPHILWKTETPLQSGVRNLTKLVSICMS